MCSMEINLDEYRAQEKIVLDEPPNEFNMTFTGVHECQYIPYCTVQC